MSLLDTNGRLFGKFNVLDAGLVLLLAIGGLGVFLVQSNLHATSQAMVEGETDIDIRVMFTLRSEDAQLLKAGEKTNIWVTLRDHATITKEGYVAEGVKVKVGVPVDLEGFKYFVHGGIVDVRPVADAVGKA